MTGTDNLDRLPTKLERFVGIAASLLLFLTLVAIVAIGSYFLIRFRGAHPVIAGLVLLGLALLAYWAAQMFVKFVRGTPEKPSPKSQLAAGMIATACGTAQLGTLVFAAVRSGRDIDPSALGAAIILVSGIAWSLHAWKQLRVHKT